MESSTLAPFTGGDWAVPDEPVDDVPQPELQPLFSIPVGEPSDGELLPASYEFPEQRLDVADGRIDGHCPRCDCSSFGCSSELPDWFDDRRLTISGSDSRRYRMRLSGDSAIRCVPITVYVVGLFFNPIRVQPIMQVPTRFVPLNVFSSSSMVMILVDGR